MAEDPFLAAIESCVKPPPQQKLYEERIEVEDIQKPPTIAVSGEFVRRVNDINIGKQQKIYPKRESILPRSEVSRFNNNIGASPIRGASSNENGDIIGNKSDIIVPSGGMVALAAGHGITPKTEQISRNEVQDWKAQVLATNRPRNQWGGLSSSEAALEESRQYARSIAALHAQRAPIEIRTEATETTRSLSGSSGDEPSPSPANSFSLAPSPANSLLNHSNRSKSNGYYSTTTGQIRYCLKQSSVTSESDKYSDYSSASSNKSTSPPQTSPNPSDYSVSTSAYHRPSDLYRNAPAEVYRNSTGAFPPKKIPPPVAKKTVTIVPGAQAIVPLPTGGAETSPRVPELSQQGPETAQRALRTSSSMTGPRPFVASLRHQIRKSANFNPMGLPVNTSNYSWTPSTSTNEVASSAEPTASPATELLSAEERRRGVFRVSSAQEGASSRNARIAEDDGVYSSRLISGNTTLPLLEEARRRRLHELSRKAEELDISENTVPPVVEEARRRRRKEVADATEEADRALFERKSNTLGSGTCTPSSANSVGSSLPPSSLTSPIPEKQTPILNSNPNSIDCAGCAQPLHPKDELATLDTWKYHAACFVCNVCRRNLRGTRYYSAKGKLYCETDYRYTGKAEASEKCAKCGHPIVDMVLQALGRYFHPNCFRCNECRACLDGIPFALDTKGEVYCMRDYHELFAPRCASCVLPILPDATTGETVRVVAVGNDYHIECYVCEGCKCRLTDEASSRCYPLGKHLLCHDCHLIWRRTGGETQPITDL